jgi:hypothetical protein
MTMTTDLGDDRLDSRVRNPFRSARHEPPQQSQMPGGGIRFFRIEPGREKGPEKIRGCIAASPMVPFELASYLFFFAFFFAAILFSSKLFEFPASIAGGARIQSSCIVTPHYLVKKKVNSGN